MAANYELVGDVEKRVRFFDGQFLQDQDFVDEQKYHLDRVRRHNRLLHVAGVAEGLAVAAAGANSVTVAPGSAIDADGRQLVLAEQATVDLPAETFNDQRGVRIALTYQESAVDRQAREGSEDDTRWLERPEIVRLAANESFKGKTPLVDLAELALDNQGTVTVDLSKREYSGVRLPGTAADTPALRATPAGQVRLSGSLTVDGNVGIGTTRPANDLEVGDFQPQNRYLALKVSGGNQYRSGLKLWTWQENYGYSIEYDERSATGNGLHVRTHERNADGTSRLFVGWNGNVGIGTTSPGAKLTVAGGGGMNIDLVVNGRLQSNNNDGGLWVAGDRFVGGHTTNQIGFYNGNAWRLTVLNNGNVGIGTTTPAAKLTVAGDVGIDGDLALAAAKKISSAGRLHISGEELLYLLNKSGVVIGKEWGGTGELTVQGTLKALGNVGIGTTAPANDLEIGNFDARNRYLALKVAGGNAYRCGLKLWAWQENYGYSIEFDERGTIANGLHVKTHDKAVDGTTRVFVGRDGNVGIGTTSPGAKLTVAGGGGSSVDFVVNGRLQSNNNDGGLWVAGDRFVGGHTTNQIGFYNGNAWRLT
ncbi:MAG TPA: hypothetical protein VKG45_01230, partial [Actinomycetes bacterium]|nr:hypothetical protein [Actinomycetes bacterium]